MLWSIVRQKSQTPFWKRHDVPKEPPTSSATVQNNYMSKAKIINIEISIEKECVKVVQNNEIIIKKEPVEALDPSQHGGRIKLLSSTSTLHDVQFAPSFKQELMATVEETGAAFHVNLDMIADGRLSDLVDSWRQKYWDQPLAQDIAVILGLNDITSLSVTEYILQLWKWRYLLLEHSRIHGHDLPSTLGVSPPARAPKYYWHPDNPFPPPPGYVNYKDKIDRLTSAIHQFNQEAGVPHMVRPHKFAGEKNVKGKTQSCFGDWREFRGPGTDYTDLLHLKAAKKVKVFMRVYKYFFHTDKLRGHTGPGGVE